MRVVSWNLPKAPMSIFQGAGASTGASATKGPSRNDQLVLRAVEIQGIYGIQFYDAQIVAAAERLGCDRILSEDLNDGQEYCSIIAVNPFKQQ